VLLGSAMSVKCNWVTAIYASELGYLLHLPFWLPRAGERLGHGAAAALAVARVALNAVALHLLLRDAEPTPTGVVRGVFGAREHPWALAWVLLLASTGLYLISYLDTWGYKMTDPTLYRLSHLSMTNFVLDTPGGGIPAIRASHGVVVVGSVVVSAVVLFAWFVLAPIDDAWACYDPAYTHTLSRYDKGTCAEPGICAQPGIDCTRPASDFADTVHYAQLAFLALFLIHLSAVQLKIDYYT